MEFTKRRFVLRIGALAAIAAIALAACDVVDATPQTLEPDAAGPQYLDPSLAGLSMPAGAADSKSR